MAIMNLIPLNRGYQTGYPVGTRYANAKGLCKVIPKTIGPVNRTQID